MHIASFASCQFDQPQPGLLHGPTHSAEAQATPALTGKKRKESSILRSKPGSSKRICADRQAPPANGNAAKPPAKPSKGERFTSYRNLGFSAVVGMLVVCPGQ